MYIIVCTLKCKSFCIRIKCIVFLIPILSSYSIFALSCAKLPYGNDSILHCLFGLHGSGMCVFESLILVV